MNKKISTFLCLLVLLLIFPYYKTIQLGLEHSTPYVLLIMWLPAIVSIITNLIFDKKLPKFGFKPFFTKQLFLSYIIPLFACIIVYGFVYISGLGGVNLYNADIYSTSSFISVVLSILTLGVVTSALTAGGEELGWRGFLFPELMKKYSYEKTSVIIGFIWLIYHLPLILFSNYNNGTSVVSSVICFAISVFAITFIANLLKLKSNSIWPCIMIHSCHNVFVQSFFDPITVDKGFTKIITTEFGIGLALVYTIVAIVYYIINKRKNVI